MKKWYKKHLDEQKKKGASSSTEYMSAVESLKRNSQKAVRAFPNPVAASKLKRPKTDSL